MTIVSADIFKRIVESDWPYTSSGDRLQVHTPDGYLFTIDNYASDGSMYACTCKLDNTCT